MAAPQPARGTRDLIGPEMARHRRVVETAREASRRYAYAEWQTPIFEATEVFSRTIGEATEIVAKEMYTFQDRGGESLTLRPEGTAGVCRALVSNGLTQSLPQRVFYAGPVFRYERPQKGRYRQFHQIGAELIGPAEPLADAESIALGRDVLRDLGLLHHVRIEINTLGDAPSRAAWREALVGYFRARSGQLSDDSRARLERNPLRIIDSKDQADRALLGEAPTIAPFLNDASRAHWDRTRDHLASFGVDFVENPRIVRGLDYYSHTAFEFTTEALGAQGTVLAGGRYDGLVSELGGPETAAVGWAAGIERLALLLDEPAAQTVSIAMVPMDPACEPDAIRLAQSLRDAGLAVEMAYRGNPRKRLERANRIGAAAVVLLGDEERASGTASVKWLATGSQDRVALAGLAAHLHARLAAHG